MNKFQVRVLYTTSLQALTKMRYTSQLSVQKMEILLPNNAKGNIQLEGLITISIFSFQLNKFQVLLFQW